MNVDMLARYEPLRLFTKRGVRRTDQATIRELPAAWAAFNEALLDLRQRATGKKRRCTILLRTKADRLASRVAALLDRLDEPEEVSISGAFVIVQTECGKVHLDCSLNLEMGLCIAADLVSLVGRQAQRQRTPNTG